MEIAMASAAYGIGAAASWGAGDFCGGVAAKQASVYRVVVGSQIFGAVALTALAVGAQESVPPLWRLCWCGLAGLAGAVGLLALYRALADGRMGMAAPVSGVLSAAVPVLAGAGLDGAPGVWTLIGFALALIAVWLVSRTDQAVFAWRGLGLPVAAGLGFGCFIVLISRASGGAVYWPLVAARAASVSVLMLTALATRQPWRPGARGLPIVIAAGLFDAGGNALLVLAAHAGRMDVAAVLSSLYPASTVLLAWMLLKERVNRWQFAGLVVALAAIAMITAR
jgi:drug/metabolite transporter (DMT)-like permease